MKVNQQKVAEIVEELKNCDIDNVIVKLSKIQATNPELLHHIGKSLFTGDGQETKEVFTIWDVYDEDKPTV